MSSRLREQRALCESRQDELRWSLLESRTLRYVLLALLIGHMGFVMVASADGDAPTYDEPAHLAAGLAYAEQGDLRFNPEHPPLAKWLSGESVALLSSTYVPSDGSEFNDVDQYGLGIRILYGEGNDVEDVLRLARAPMIGLTLALVLVAYGFASELFGYAGGLLTVALLTTDPNLLAHGRLVTTDVPMTLFLIASLYLVLLIYRHGPKWQLVLPAGGCLGLALATKYSALLLVPVVATLLYAAALRSREEGVSSTRRGALVATLWALCAALATVWIIYLAIDPSLSFSRPPTWPPEAQRRLLDLLPLPEPYREGLNFTLTADRQGRTGYLFGDVYSGGRAVFFPAVLVLKTPIGTLIAWVLGAALIVVRRRNAAILFLMAPAGWWMIFALASKTNLGVRHVIIVSVLLSIAAGALVSSHRSPLRHLALPLALAAAVSSWAAAPHHLPYINEAFGGSSRSGDLVSDSNVDWGQDLFRLVDTLEEAYPAESQPWILYFGSTDLEAFAVDFRDVLEADPSEVHGLVAISISARNSHHPEIAEELVDRGTLIETVGRSIELYRVRPAT